MSESAIKEYNRIELQRNILAAEIFEKKHELEEKTKSFKLLNSLKKSIRLEIIDRTIDEIKGLDVKTLLNKLVYFSPAVNAIIFSQIENCRFLEQCTCERSNYNQYIKCIKHPSRFNKGCYYCDYTDCSLYRC